MASPIHTHKVDMDLIRRAAAQELGYSQPVDQSKKNGHSTEVDIAAATQPTAPTQPSISVDNSEEKIVNAQPAYLQNALLQAALGIPVELFLANTKACKVPSWEETCTTDAAEIIRRAEARPDHKNIALVAKAVPGGPCFLDDDGGIRTAFEAKGRMMLPTRRHKSCSGNFHYVYRHSAKSLAFWEKSKKKAYISEAKPEGGEMWSFRMNNAYIVGPGSTAVNHDGVLAEYKTVNNLEIIEIPDDLLEFLTNRWETIDGNSVPATATTAATNQNTGILDPVARQLAVEKVCGTPDQKILHGAHDTTLTGIAGELRRIGLEKDEMESVLIDVCEKRCVGYGSDYREMCRKIAGSISKKEKGKDTTVYINGHVAGALVGVMTPKMVGIAEAQKSQEDERLKAAEQVKKELESRIGPWPVFPEWVFQNTSIFRGLVKPYCDANSRQPEFLFMPSLVLLMNYIGLKVKIEHKEITPSFYLVMIGKRGQLKKSSSVNDAIKYFKSIGAVDFANATTRNSEGKTLIWSAGSPEGLGIEAQRVACKNICLFYDELKGLINKSGIENSSLVESLLKLYDSSYFANSIKNRKEGYVFEPGTYCASLITCTTDKTFKSLWAGLSGGDTGLNDRTFFLLQPKVLKQPIPFTAVDTTTGAIETRKLIDRAIQQGTFSIEDPSPLEEMMTGEDPFTDRQEIRAEKLALAFAVDMGKGCIDGDALERGIALVKYERAVKRRLRPYEAENRDAAVQQKIIEALETALGSLSLRDLERKLHIDRIGTMMWGRAFEGLKDSGRIGIFGTGKQNDPKVIKLLRIVRSDDDE
jgi:hypothetical protein